MSEHLEDEILVILLLNCVMSPGLLCR